jgi:hypothetical protein
MKDDFEHIITKTSIDLLHKGKNEEINVASNRDLLVETKYSVTGSS